MSDMRAPREALNEFSTAAQALQHRPPARLARAVTLTLCVFAVAAIAYAWLAHMDVVVTAPGRVVPSGKTVVVQSVAPGAVLSLHASEGQSVRAGDVVLTLATADGGAFRLRGAGDMEIPGENRQVGPGPGAAQAWLDARLLESLSKLATLDAEVARRRSDRDAVAAVIQQLSASQELVARKHAMRERLARTGHMTESNLIESKLELINVQKELAVQRNRLQETEAALTAAIQSRTQADAEYKARFPAELVEVSRRAAPGSGHVADGQQVLASPADGIVHWIAAVGPGDPVGAAQNLFVVVPQGAPLEVEALVFNKDVGHLRAGQRAIVKVETYDYTRYGHIEGEVQWMGADAIADPKLGPVFATRVAPRAFETPNTVNGMRGHLAPGMTVTVDVRVAERRVIEYFLAPLFRYKEESLRER
jgi:hemolysin D